MVAAEPRPAAGRPGAYALSLQLVRRIAKLRVAGAERRAFAAWAQRFSRQSRAGTYEELAAQDGVFRRLALRQLL